jgi:hypothetical protein
MELTEVFEDQFARMPVMNMAWAALLEGGLAGTALAAACRRWTRRPRSYFVALAIAGLIASFALPITSDASTATKVVLTLSHVVVAIIIVPALALALPGRTARHHNMPVKTDQHTAAPAPRLVTCRATGPKSDCAPSRRAGTVRNFVCDVRRGPYGRDVSSG